MIPYFTVPYMYIIFFFLTLPSLVLLYLISTYFTCLLHTLLTLFYDALFYLTLFYLASPPMSRFVLPYRNWMYIIWPNPYFIYDTLRNLLFHFLIYETQRPNRRIATTALTCSNSTIPHSLALSCTCRVPEQRLATGWPRERPRVGGCLFAGRVHALKSGFVDRCARRGHHGSYWGSPDQYENWSGIHEGPLFLEHNRKSLTTRQEGKAR